MPWRKGEFTVEGDPGGPADIVEVVAPPSPNRRGLPGFKGVNGGWDPREDGAAKW
jgi:hypothetical protein